MKATVIGCGRWGTFIAWYLCYLKHDVTLYGRSTSASFNELSEKRANKYLTLPDEMKLSSDLSVIEQSDSIFISIHSQNLRRLCEQLKDYDIADKHIVLCMKGIEISSGKRLSEVVHEVIGEEAHVSVWLGPGHVQEYIHERPNCMVIDSDEHSEKKYLIDQLSDGFIRFYIGTDIAGNEIGGATKNIIGIAAGCLDGLGLTSLKGALMARGTYEISKLIAAQGGDPISAYGLCHLGDYETTLFSEHSHNRRFGEDFIKGVASESFAEGVETAKAVYEIAQEKGLDLPICTTIYDILYNGKDPSKQLNSLFERSLKREFMK